MTMIMLTAPQQTVRNTAELAALKARSIATALNGGGYRDGHPHRGRELAGPHVDPPELRRWLGFHAYQTWDADQTWTVIIGPDGRLQAQTYVVDAFGPMSGLHLCGDPTRRCGTALHRPVAVGSPSHLDGRKTAMPDADLVLKMYEYFNVGDLDRVRRELFAEDIVWHMPGHHPLSGEHTGADEVMAFFGALSKAGIRVDDVHFGELENGTVIERHLGHASIGDDKFLFPTVTSYEIEEGRLKRVQVHAADQHNVDRYMWTVFGLKPITERLAD